MCIPTVLEALILFEINLLEFFWPQSFVQKWKSLNLEPKMPYLGTFALEFENTIVILEMSALEFDDLQNLVQK